MAYCKRCGFPDELNGLNNDPQQQLLEVEDVILQLEAQLSKRMEQRRALKQQLNTQNSPLIRLPLDILSEISMAAFPEGDSDSWNGATPLLLGSICRTWRDVAWSMPRLWRTIRVEVPIRRYRILKTSLLEEWLLRSRQSPLSLYLRLAKPKVHEGHPEDVVMWKIMDHVARCSERWQHVHLDIPFFFREEKCFVPHGFSQLRSLYMSGLENDSDFPIGLDIFKHAPVLSEASLRGYVGENRIFLPITNLRRLTVGYISADNCLLLLEQYPNLVHCAFQSLLGSRSPTRFTAVEARLLESLELKFTEYGAPAISSLLDNLSTPSLRDLAIHFEGDGTFPPANLIIFIQRSSCSLVRLDLFHVRISDAQLVECLAILPSLRELKLGAMEIRAHTVHRLTITLDQDGDPLSESLLPNLTSLSLVLIGHILFDVVDLVRMVRSRRGIQAVGTDSKQLAVARMEAVSVRVITYGAGCQGLPTVAELTQFQELEDEGMRVHLDISPPTKTEAEMFNRIHYS